MFLLHQHSLFPTHRPAEFPMPTSPEVDTSLLEPCRWQTTEPRPKPNSARPPCPHIPVHTVLHPPSRTLTTANLKRTVECSPFLPRSKVTLTVGFFSNALEEPTPIRVWAGISCSLGQLGCRHTDLLGPESQLPLSVSLLLSVRTHHRLQPPGLLADPPLHFHPVSEPLLPGLGFPCVSSLSESQPDSILPNSPEA